ncbi:MAG: hypothetical protein E7661_05745 [Ruminococcaceae bacterium]|nr:hypothetical protein [Oscillospiraceae bacterium]
MAFSASITFIPSATENPTRISGQLSITYTAPEALNGMTLTCHFLTPEDLYGSDLPITVTYPAPSENMTVTLPSSSVAGLLSPGAVLFPIGDVTDVSPLRDGTKTVTIQKNPLSSEIFPSIIIYTLSESEIFPLSITSENEKTQLTIEICD